jgi:hypothetical protein
VDGLGFRFAGGHVPARGFRKPRLSGDDFTVFPVVEWRVVHAGDFLGVFGGAAQGAADAGGEVFGFPFGALGFHGGRNNNVS